MTMTALKYPSILTDLGHVGDLGLPISEEAWFQEELALCREWGFAIKTVPLNAERIRLEYDGESLVPYWISQETPAISWSWLRTVSFLRVDSTNRAARDEARAGAREGTLIYAETQTSGRGRMNRSWFSPAGTGIYCSLILRPDREWSRWPLLTHVAAVSLIDALRGLERKMQFPRKLDIDLKWPNDVLLSGKKCAGILLETVTLDGKNSTAVIGIGINVHPGSVPADLLDVATCVDEMSGVTTPRRNLLVAFLKYFQKNYEMFRKEEYSELLERWKEYSSMWNNVAVAVHEGDCVRDAVTCGLDEMGALRVCFADGSIETVLAGDVSIRKI